MTDVLIVINYLSEMTEATMPTRLSFLTLSNQIICVSTSIMRYEYVLTSFIDKTDKFK